ncbi:dethiobiotin synthase [Tomitella biformata]|uniref:dethiobiotin synthase n=1 Tax=Tomitella biformata TaxID=630403 RepID=UPI000462F0EA|nr:dethiobiotin synthase [Tomitella biformata]
MSIVLITGTSTDVGKTIATAALACRPGPVAVCKPAQTGLLPGEPGDLAVIERLAEPAVALELARYPDPLAPDTAAGRAGLPLLELGPVAAAIRALDAAHELTLVEGAGGVLVRLGEGGFTLLDLARELDAPMLVVAAAGLGTLNHTELTVAAIEAAGVRCAGIVIGTWPERPGLAARCNLGDLARIAPVLGRLPAGAGGLSRSEFAAAAPGWITGL